MCNCREEITTKLIERFKKNKPEAQDVHIEINGYAIIFDDEINLNSKPYLPINGAYKLPTKNGGFKSKKLKDSLIASFCPFCGVSLAKAD